MFTLLLDSWRWCLHNATRFFACVQKSHSAQKNRDTHYFFQNQYCQVTGLFSFWAGGVEETHGHTIFRAIRTLICVNYSTRLRGSTARIASATKSILNTIFEFTFLETESSLRAQALSLVFRGIVSNQSTNVSRIYRNLLWIPFRNTKELRFITNSSQNRMAHAES